MLKRIRKHWILHVALVLLFCSATGNSFADSASPKKHVLVLMSYGRTNLWTESIMEGILDTFDNRGDIELFVQYMDTKRFLNADYKDCLADCMKRKFFDVTFDAILLSDNNALDFVVGNREELFKDVPVVFCGVSNYSDDMLNGQDGISGYEESFDIPGTIKVILKLFPKTKYLYVISDNTVSGQADLACFEKNSKAYADSLEFRYLTNLTTAQLKHELSKLPKKSAVLALSFYKDADGVLYGGPEFMSLIAGGTDRPVFTLWASQVCNGAVGGKVISGYQQGQSAAHMVLGIVDSKKDFNGVVHKASPNVFMFDGCQLKRFGVDFNLLPPGSIIINPSYTFYEKYSVYIWTGILVIIIETCLIFGLIVNIKLRKRGQRQLLISENKFRSYIENAPDGIFIVNSKAVFVEVNKHASAMTGYRRDELVGMTISSIMDDEYVAAGNAHFKKVVSEGQSSGVLKFKRKDGGRRWWSVDAVKLSDDRFIGFCKDVTTAKSRETDLINARRQELHVGFEIQNQLLLGQPPKNIKGARIAACSIPSDCIDGDFYDFVQYDSEHFDLILGDVMGKGVSAALCGAATKAQFLRAIYELMCSSTLATLPTLEEIATFAHHQMCKGLMNIESFVTACIARFNMNKMRMDIVDCGHPSTIHYHHDTGKCELIKGRNFPIGFSEQDHYEQMSIHFKTGDILFFHSDGVMETKGQGDKIFGTRRIENFIKDHSYMQPDQLTRALSDELKHFSGNHFSDDITYIIVKFEEVFKPQLIRSTKMEFSSVYESIEKIREMISTNLGLYNDADEKFCLELNIAISEAVTNIIKHGYDGSPEHSISIILKIYSEHVEVSLVHDGKTMDKRQFATPAFDGSHDNGYGLYLIRNCVDEIKLSTNVNHITTMSLIKSFRTSGGDRGSMKRF